MKDILFLVPYPLHRAPSQRFRVELYEPILQKHQLSYTIAPFMDEATWNVLYKQSSVIKKAMGILKSFLKRWVLLFSATQYRYVFIHREAAPLGPPLVEWMLAKVFRKKIIYDFDDAIWIPNTSEANKLAAQWKAFWKVKYICQWAYRITAGNAYLSDFAKQYNEQVVLLPTCVDIENGHSKLKQHHSNIPVIGWTGSHSTLVYLDDIVPVLKELQQEIAFEIVIIADKKPDWELPHQRFIPWNEQTEQEDLLQIDIGIMPLKENAWSEGKCGFKLIQYLALGIPAVAAPVGVNNNIIDHGVNGFLCTSKEEWKGCLKQLVTNAAVRKQMGLVGREKIVKEYSIQSQEEKFISLFT